MGIFLEVLLDDNGRTFPILPGEGWFISPSVLYCILWSQAWSINWSMHGLVQGLCRKSLDSFCHPLNRLVGDNSNKKRKKELVYWHRYAFKISQILVLLPKIAEKTAPQTLIGKCSRLWLCDCINFIKTILYRGFHGNCNLVNRPSTFGALYISSISFSSDIAVLCSSQDNMRFILGIVTLCLTAILSNGLILDSSQKNVILAKVMAEAKAKADLAVEFRMTNGVRSRKATPE